MHNYHSKLSGIRSFQALSVNICEMKYSPDKYEITKEEHQKMLHRREVFIAEQGLRGAAYLTLVTTCGVVHNAYWNDIQSEVTLDDLFL